MASITQVRERPQAVARGQAENMASIKKIGVIGAGQMGNGIAHVAALAGMDVLLNDISTDRINAGLATINGNLTRQVSRKLISEEDRQAALARIAAADKLDKLGDCDLVIESAAEKEEIKRKIFSDLCPHLRPDCDHRNQHLVDLDHPARRLDRPSGEIHRHSFHEPGAGDGTGRADSAASPPTTRRSRRAASSSRNCTRRSRSRRISRPSSSTASCCR
jgi:threonine dehydrogenase-like Zn-dependent dehydrogenase